MVLGFTKTMLINGKKKPTNFEEKIKKGIKLHTIRQDEKKRWKPETKIHFATGVRTSNYNCFKEGVCKSIQDVTIKFNTVYIDGIQLNYHQLEEFSINDGFDNVDDFWEWFNQYQPFTGRLIHWSNLKY